ncbi:MAG: response regulator transcription factor [Candidatus Fimenecus sp.]
MQVVSVDDERLALEDLRDICLSLPQVTGFDAFSNPADALEHAAKHRIDLAFLDIEMPVMSGLELAERLLRIDKNIKIIFVTGFKEYAFDAFGVNAIGYVLKPFSEDMIRHEIEKASSLQTFSAAHSIQMKTFGYFDVFVQNKPVYFSSSKAKELLALLVDRRGGSVSTENAISMLWPDRDYDETVQSLFRKVLKSLRVSLADAGISDILIDVRNQRSVDTDKFTCDLYALLQKNKTAMESYTGEYMLGYQWAQTTKQHLDTICGR